MGDFRCGRTAFLDDRLQMHADSFVGALNEHLVRGKGVGLDDAELDATTVVGKRLRVDVGALLVWSIEHECVGDSLDFPLDL